jgi:hypothetical protein
MEAKTTQKLRYLAGIVLIISSITHLVQLALVGFEWHDIAAATIGGLYGLLGILLLLIEDNKPLTFTGIVFPFIGGTLGFVRLISIEIGVHGTINWFIVWHLIADAIIVPSLFCYYISFTDMNRKEKLSFLSVVLLFIMGIMHILQIYYGVYLENIGLTIFGILYITFAVLLQSKNDIKMFNEVAILLLLIGAILDLVLFYYIVLNPFLIFFLTVDLIIVYLLFHINQTYYKEG